MPRQPCAGCRARHSPPRPASNCSSACAIEDPAVTPALRWLEELLATQGTTAEEMVRLEHQRQATMNVTVRNVITSMRLISWFDWAEFVESVSLVDDVLREHGSFSQMDFATRDRHRHAVEELARDSGAAESSRSLGERPTWPSSPAPRPTICRLRSARPFLPREWSATCAAGPAPAARAGLLPHRRGQAGLRARSRRPHAAQDEAATVLCPGRHGRIHRVDRARHGADRRRATPPLVRPPNPGPGHHPRRSPRPRTGLRPRGLARQPVGDAVLGPRRLPRLDLDAGVPTDLRTLVVVPMLLTNEADAEAQANGLEVHYLGNREGDLRFALLSDWLDAPTESVPGDDELLSTVAAAIDRLNERHGEAPGGGARFLLFHRARRWNDVDRTWMGWERKRGKLHELNELLRGSTTTSFMTTGRAASTPPRTCAMWSPSTRTPDCLAGRSDASLARSPIRSTRRPSTRSPVG